MNKSLKKLLSLTLALGIGTSSVFIPNVNAQVRYDAPLNSPFTAASAKAQEANPWEYKTYQYGRREGIHNTPTVSVTYTGDNTVKVVARFNPQGENWGGRPYYGITVPNGFNMPEKIIRREFWGREQIKYSEISVADWPSSSRFSEIGTNKIGYEWRNRVTTSWGYDGDENELNRRFKTKTQALFLSWEKTGARIYELEYTTTVKDFKAQNNVLATFSQVLNRYSRHGGVYAARPKPVPPAPPKPKMAETYNLKRPAQTPVADPVATLSSEEQNTVIDKIKQANDGLDAIALVQYNQATKEFEVEFNDDHSKITIPQAELVYKKPVVVESTEDDASNLPFNLGEKVMLASKEEYDNVGISNDIKYKKAVQEAIVRLIHANKYNHPWSYSAIDATPTNTSNNYGRPLDNIGFTNTDGPKLQKGGTPNYYYLIKSPNSETYYAFGDSIEDKDNKGLKYYELDGWKDYDDGNTVRNLYTGKKIAHSLLFTYPDDPRNVNPNAINQNDKDAAKNTIDSILNPSKFPGIDNVPTVRDQLKERVDGANSREDLDNIIAEANREAEKFKLQLANNKLNAEKDRAKQIIEGLTNISDSEKQRLLNEVDSINVDANKSYDQAKSEIDGKVAEALRQDVEALKTKLKEEVDALPNPITDGSANDVFKPEEVKQAIDAILSNDVNGNTTTHADRIAKLNKLKQKAKIDSEREETLDKLNNSTLNNKDALIEAIKNNAPDGEGGDNDTNALAKIDEAKKALDKAKADESKEKTKKELEDLLPPGTEGNGKLDELKDEIDNANSTAEIEAIIEKAKAEKAKADAKKKVDELTHLNQAQKNFYKEQIDGSASPEDINGLIHEATELDNSMADLIAEVAKSKQLKDGSDEKYTSASQATKTPFDAALTEAQPIVNLQTTEKGHNLDNDEVSALLNKLQKARLSLAPDNQSKTDKDVVKELGAELKLELKEKNKQTKEDIKNSFADYDGANATLGNKDDQAATGSIITEAERKIDEALAKLDNDSATPEAVNHELDRIKTDTLKEFAKEKLKAAIDKLRKNIEAPLENTDGKTAESIEKFNKEKESATATKTEAEEALNSDRHNQFDYEDLYNKVLEADKKLTEKRVLEDEVNTAGLNAKIAEFDTLLGKDRPTTLVKEPSRIAVENAKTDANTTLGNKTNPAENTARAIAAKPKPTRDEVDSMIQTLTEKIEAYKQKLAAEREDAKNKLTEIANTLLTNANDPANTKKNEIIAKINKLTDPTDTTVTNADTYISGLIDEIATAAANGFANLNQAQKDAAKLDLKAKAEAITATSDMTTLTNAIAGYTTLDNKMLDLAKLKAKGDSVKEQVKYIKEFNAEHRTAFDTAHGNLTFTDNKTAGDVDELINAYNTAYNNLDGTAVAPDGNDRVRVANPKNITEDEQRQILAAIYAANRDIEDKINKAGSSVNPATGEVTIAYNDARTSALNEALSATPNSTMPASSVIVTAFTEPAKTLVVTDGNSNLTTEDKNKVKDAILKANKTLSEGNSPQLTADNITVNDDGSVSVSLPNNQRVDLTADKVVDKTKKPNAKAEVATKKTEITSAIDNLALPKDQADALKAELTTIETEANTAIDNAQTDFEAADKVAAYNTATGAVDTATNTAKLKMDKVKAKAELEKKAKEQKDAINALRPLAESERTKLTQAIDQALQDAKEAIERADNSAAITTAKEEGSLKIDQIKAKADLANKATEINNSIDAMTGLSPEKKQELKDAVNTLLNEENGKIDTANAANLNNVLEAGKQKLNEKLAEAERSNLDNLNDKIAKLDELTKKARSDKFVTDKNKNKVDELKTDAIAKLGTENNPAEGTARHTAQKQPQASATEVSAMITDLDGKIEALTNALNKEREDSKNKLTEIVNALFPDKDGQADPNKEKYLDKVAKLTDGSAETQANPAEYINNLITEATRDAVDGYTNLNDLQKARLKEDLINKVNAITPEGNVATITEAVTNLKTLDEKMAEVTKLKGKAAVVKTQVKYLKEKTDTEKEAFDTAVDNLTFTDNKTADQVEKLIEAYNNALNNLDGKAEAPERANRVVVKNPARLTDAEKTAIKNAILNKNNDIADKIDADRTVVADNGEVTIVYNDGSQVGNEAVTSTANSTLTASEVLIPSFTKPAKVLVSLDKDGNLTEADKEKIKDAIIAANRDLTTGDNPILSKDKISFAENGDIIVRFDDNYSETVTEAEAVDKTTKPNAITEITTKNDEATNLLDGLGLAKEKKDELATELAKIVEDAKEAIANANTDLTADNKEEAFNEAVRKVEEVVADTKLAIDKLKAKAELEKLAQTQKDAINNLPNLSAEEKKELTDAIDAALAKAKDAIDKATDNDKITEAKDAGILEINKIKAKADVQDKKKEVEKVLEKLTNIPEEERNKLRPKIEDMVEAYENEIANATTENDINNVVDKAKVELEKEKAKAEIIDSAEKIKAEIEAMPNLSEDQKKKLKEEVDNDAKAGVDSINQVQPDATTRPEDSIAKINEAKDKTISELEKDKAKAELIDKAEGISKEIDKGLPNLSDKQQDELIKKVEEAINKIIEKIDNVSTEGTSEENKKALDDVINASNPILNRIEEEARNLNKDQAATSEFFPFDPDGNSAVEKDKAKAEANKKSSKQKDHQPSTGVRRLA